MAGFTDAACRHLMADHGAAWTVSEMASAKAITFGDAKRVRLRRDKASPGIYAGELCGAEPQAPGTPALANGEITTAEGAKQI